MKVNVRRKQESKQTENIINDRINAFESMKLLAIEKDINFSDIGSPIGKRVDAIKRKAEDLNLFENEIAEIIDSLGYKYVQCIEGKEHLMSAGNMSRQFDSYRILYANNISKIELARRLDIETHVVRGWFKGNDLREKEIFELANVLNVKYVRKFIDKETGEVFHLSDDIFKRIKQGLSINGFHIYDLMRELDGIKQRELKEKILGIGGVELSNYEMAVINEMTGFNYTLDDYRNFRLKK